MTAASDDALTLSSVGTLVPSYRQVNGGFGVNHPEPVFVIEVIAVSVGIGSVLPGALRPTEFVASFFRAEAARNQL